MHSSSSYNASFGFKNGMSKGSESKINAFLKNSATRTTFVIFVFSRIGNWRKANELLEDLYGNIAAGKIDFGKADIGFVSVLERVKEASEGFLEKEKVGTTGKGEADEATGLVDQAIAKKMDALNLDGVSVKLKEPFERIEDGLSILTNRAREFFYEFYFKGGKVRHIAYREGFREEYAKELRRRLLDRVREKSGPDYLTGSDVYLYENYRRLEEHFLYGLSSEEAEKLVLFLDSSSSDTLIVDFFTEWAGVAIASEKSVRRVHEERRKKIEAERKAKEKAVPGAPLVRPSESFSKKVSKGIAGLPWRGIFAACGAVVVVAVLIYIFFVRVSPPFARIDAVSGVVSIERLHEGSVGLKMGDRFYPGEVVRVSNDGDVRFFWDKERAALDLEGEAEFSFINIEKGRERAIELFLRNGTMEWSVASVDAIPNITLFFRRGSIMIHSRKAEFSFSSKEERSILELRKGSLKINDWNTGEKKVIDAPGNYVFQ